MSAAASPRLWLYNNVTWGVTLCEAPRCALTAEILADEVDGRGVPLCLDCADLWLDRATAVAWHYWWHRDHDDMLPPLYEVDKRERPTKTREPVAPGMGVLPPDWDIPW